MYGLAKPNHSTATSFSMLRSLRNAHTHEHYVAISLAAPNLHLFLVQWKVAASIAVLHLLS